MANYYHAVVIEQSLKDKGVLKSFKIQHQKHSGDWVLDVIEVGNPKLAIEAIQKEMVEDKGFYWHIYDNNKNLIIVFRDKVFYLDPRDMTTWEQAQAYGEKVLKIIPEQLDFFPTKLSDEEEWLRGKN